VASAARGGSVFSLEDVGYAYEPGPEALRGVSLAVDRGERLAILGANGSGKSTLLRILDGLLHPTAGSFRAFGSPIDEAALRDRPTAIRFRRRVGLVFQSADAQLFSSTVREEIAFGPLQLGLDPGEVEQRIADVASLLGLDGLMDRPPFRLSGGEKKKVAIAAVLVVNPEVVLLDEPTGGLDPRTKSWLVEFLNELHGAGKTLVLATNDLEIVPEVADRALLLNEVHGVEAEGPARLIVEDAALLQSANVIHEHAHRHGSRYHAHSHFHGGDHDHSHE
jgi:cobalt/nickel transport system ATP-binding protein